MGQIQALLEWAASQGIEIGGIQPVAKADCGIGMAATKTLQVPS